MLQPTPEDQLETVRTRLDRVVATHRLVRSVVETFLLVSSDQVDPAIGSALEQLGSGLAVDRAYVFHFRGDVSDNTHEWCGPGIPAEIDNLQAVPNDVIRPWLAPFQRGEHVYIADVDALPPERGAEQEILVAQGIRSLLAVPLISLGQLRGFVGFDSVRCLRDFDSSEIEILRSAADAINAAEVRRDSNAEVARAHDRLIALTRQTSDIMAVIGSDERVSFANPSWERIGLGVDEVVGKRWDALIEVCDDNGVTRMAKAMMNGSLQARRIQLPDFSFRDGSGELRWLTATLTDLRNDPAVGGVVLNAQEITDRKQAEARLAHDALHDPLTGLGNRTQFHDRLELTCRQAARNHRGIAVLFLDLDRFKLINDGHGHAVGDELLRVVGQRMQAAVRSTDTVARFGGDEFLVLLDGIDATEVDGVIHVLRSAISQPVVVGTNTYHVTASIGAAVAAGVGLDPETLIRDADTAMYQAKDRGRDQVAVFDPELHRTVLRRVELVHRLPAALDEKRIEVHYQPVVDLRSGRILGAEALARWHDPQLGWIPPSEFIAVAEEIGLVARLGEQVLTQALSDVKRWPDDFRVAVNLSPAQLTRTDLARGISYQLSRAGVPASRLCLELTESMLMEDPGAAVEVLQSLRELGVLTALDDFGTGFSSLAMLRELPIDILKIDRAFVNGVDRSVADRRLVDAVLSLAEDFDMLALAEGVETASQRAALDDAGCSLAQGYLFSRPMPADEFEALVNSHEQRCLVAALPARPRSLVDEENFRSRTPVPINR